MCEVTSSFERSNLADPTFDKPGRIDLLLGCNISQDVPSQEVSRGTPTQPFTIDSMFGWAILGRYNLDCGLSSTSTFTSIHHAISGPDVDSILQRFWIIEEIAADHTHNFTQEEQVAVDHFSNTHAYLSTGRYKVTLPRRSDVSQLLGESRAKAIQRFNANELSIIRKGTYEEFKKVVLEYLDLDHAELVHQSTFSVPPHLSYYRCVQGE